MEGRFAGLRSGADTSVAYHQLALLHRQASDTESPAESNEHLECYQEYLIKSVEENPANDDARLALVRHFLFEQPALDSAEELLAAPSTSAAPFVGLRGLLFSMTARHEQATEHLVAALASGDPVVAFDLLRMLALGFELRDRERIAAAIGPEFPASARQALLRSLHTE
jgi:hypothetical protein